MRDVDLLAYLQERPYPGRGLILARPCDDVVSVSVFLSGRSEGSRAREITSAANRLTVGPTGETPDDPLRHYDTAILSGTRIIVGNGRQVTHLANAGHGPGEVENDLASLEYEPDAPIYTPRISLVVDVAGAEMLATVGVASRAPSGATRNRVHAVETLGVGWAWLVHTYDGAVGSPEASGYVIRTRVDQLNADQFSAAVWKALDPRYRVAVATRQTRLGRSWADDGKWAIAQGSVSTS